MSLSETFVNLDSVIYADDFGVLPVPVCVMKLERLQASATADVAISTSACQLKKLSRNAGGPAILKQPGRRQTCDGRRVSESKQPMAKSLT